MYCKKCGKELNNDERYCPICGTEQDSQVTLNGDPFDMPPQVEEKKPLRVWSIFSTIGKILGIVSLVVSWIPFGVGLELGIMGGIFGIVFSCLGRKAQTDASRHNFKIGLILSIVAIVVSIIALFIWLAIGLGALGSAISSY